MRSFDLKYIQQQLKTCKKPTSPTALFSFQFFLRTLTQKKQFGYINKFVTFDQLKGSNNLEGQISVIKCCQSELISLQSNT